MQTVEDKINELHMGRLIHMLSHQMQRKGCISDAIHEDSLTAIQKQVLGFILMETLHRELYQKDIEEEFHVRKSTVTGMLQLMEKKGLIIRESVAKDARLKRIVPTKKAETLRPSILAHIQQSEARLTAGISEGDVLCCKKVLCQMLQNLSN